MIETVKVPDLLARVRPGSFDGWSWEQEARWCWSNHFDEMVTLVRSLLVDGQKDPVLAGDDGRLWDGHHRLVALIAIGEPYVRVDWQNGGVAP